MAVIRFHSRKGRLADAERITPAGMDSAASEAAQAIALVVRAVPEARLGVPKSVPMPAKTRTLRIEPGYQIALDKDGAPVKDKRGRTRMTRDSMYVDSPGSPARLKSDRGDWDLVSADSRVNQSRKLRFPSKWGKGQPRRVNQGHMPQD